MSYSDGFKEGREDALNDVHMHLEEADSPEEAVKNIERLLQQEGIL